MKVYLLRTERETYGVFSSPEVARNKFTECDSDWDEEDLSFKGPYLSCTEMTVDEINVIDS